MPTKTLVPRASGEGGLGATDNAWGLAYYDTGNFNKGLFVSGKNIDEIIADAVTGGGLGGVWNAVAGGKIYYNGGNVGIGTTNPNELLHVENDSFGDLISIRTLDGTNNPRMFIGTNSTGVYIRNSHSTSAGDIDFQDGLGNSKVLITEQGKVGIGTTSPNVNLSIVSSTIDTDVIPLVLSTVDPSVSVNQEVSIGFGQADVTFAKISSYYAGSTGSGGFGLKMYTGGNAGSGVDRTQTNPSLTIDQDGKVGIGTTTPDSELEVNGGLNIGSGDGTNSGLVKLKGTIDVTKDTKDIVGTNTKFQEELRPEDIVYINNIDYVVSVISSNTQMTLTSNITASGNGVTPYRKNRRETILASDSGNIGFGTLTPKYRLECFGKNKSSINITSDHLEANGTFTRIQHAAMSTDAAGFGKLEIFSDVGNPQVVVKSNGGSFFNGGNVGIGVVSPQAKLEINGGVMINPTLNSGDNRGVWFGKNSVSQGYIGGGDFAITFLNDDDFGISAAQDGNLVFGTSTATTGPDHERMRISPGGNVGIGTTSPSATLDIDGDLKYSGPVTQNGTDQGQGINTISQHMFDDTTNMFQVYDVNSTTVSEVGLYRLPSPVGQVPATNKAFGYLLVSRQGRANAEATNDIIYSDANGNLKMATSFPSARTGGGNFVGAQTSDERLKDINDDFSYGLSDLLKLTPISYTLKKDKTSTTKLGFGAQTTQLVIPESVSDTGECIDGYDQSEGKESGDMVPRSEDTALQMEYVQLIPVLTKAIQEQQQLIEDLRSEVEALKNK